jgi:predicted DNA-binding transcriptional regulator AlpA
MTERLTTNEVASLLGVSPRTVASYAARGQMPKPSACPCCGHSPTWLRSEIDSWSNRRPGRGVGGGRPRKSS